MPKPAPDVFLIFGRNEDHEEFVDNFGAETLSKIRSMALEIPRDKLLEFRLPQGKRQPIDIYALKEGDELYQSIVFERVKFNEEVNALTYYFREYKVHVIRAEETSPEAPRIEFE